MNKKGVISRRKDDSLPMGVGCSKDGAFKHITENELGGRSKVGNARACRTREKRRWLSRYSKRFLLTQ